MNERSTKSDCCCYPLDLFKVEVVSLLRLAFKTSVAPGKVKKNYNALLEKDTP